MDDRMLPAAGTVTPTADKVEKLLERAAVVLEQSGAALGDR